MSNITLKRCPCGRVPTKLHVPDSDASGKYAYTYPNCCTEWLIEFRVDNKPLDSDEVYKLAVKAWNSATRSRTL